MRTRTGLLLLLVLLIFAGIFWLFLVEPEVAAPRSVPQPALEPGGNLKETAPLDVVRDVRVANGGSGAVVDFPRGTIRGELVLYFTSEAEYLAYLNALKEKGFGVLGRIDELWVLRTGMDAVTSVPPGLFGGRIDFSYLVQRPPVPREISPALLGTLRPFSEEAGAVSGGALGGRGAGIVVAVIDSGIAVHPSFEGTVVTKAGSFGTSGEELSHGTAVASIISGQTGLAPDATLVDLRVLGADGTGSAFDVAEALVEAVRQGADIANLSLGVHVDTPVLAAAVRYASENGLVLVAAAGNDALDALPYPAAYPEVLSVTAVDANGRHALFPNRGAAIDFAAPGVGVRVAGPEGGEDLFSGTSAAAPFVSGALASLMSGDSGLTPAEAVERIRRSLDEAGAPGDDPLYGGGVLAWDRIREADTEGLVDLAVADVHLRARPAPGVPVVLDVSVQNRGTAWLPGGSLEVRVGEGGAETFPLESLGAGEVTSRTVYAVAPPDGMALDVVAWVEPAAGDVRPGNNGRAVRIGSVPPVE